MWRPVRLRVILASGVVYRLFIIAVQTMFFWCLTGQLTWAVGTSLAWNCVNMVCYYLYHVLFAKIFSVGTPAPQRTGNRHGPNSSGTEFTGKGRRL